jgi:hypothetical protein
LKLRPLGVIKYFFGTAPALISLLMAHRHRFALHMVLEAQRQLAAELAITLG